VAKLPNPLGSPVQPQCSAGKQGIKPVEAGLVIDHIGVGQSVRDIWETISKVRKLIGLNVISSHGVYESTSREPGSYKGIISLPNHPDLSHTELRRLAAIAPECTLNIVEDNMVIVKYRLHMPPKIYNFKDIGCKNEVCISNPKHFENVNPCFVRVDDENNTFACVYCERVFRYQDIWHS
jgi:aspartate carbamoyltransferase